VPQAPQWHDASGPMVKQPIHFVIVKQNNSSLFNFRDLHVCITLVMGMIDVHTL